MKHSILAAALAATTFAATAAEELYASLDVASVDKLVQSVTRICGIAGQPMLGAIAAGSVQQFLQNSVGPVDNTKPGSISVFADSGKLKDVATEKLLGRADLLTFGAAIPFTGTEEAFVSGRKLEKDEDGLVELPDGIGKMLASLQNGYAYIGNEKNGTELAKKRVPVVPFNDNTLALTFATPALQFLKPPAETNSNPEIAELLIASQKKSEEQLAQLSSLALGLGFSDQRGLQIDIAATPKPGTLLAKAISEAKPLPKELLAEVPADALLVAAATCPPPEVAAQDNGALVAILEQLIKENVAKEYPELAETMIEVIRTSAKIMPAAKVSSIGFDEKAKLWMHGRVIARPGEDLIAAQASQMRKLVAALHKAFPESTFISISEDGLEATFDWEKFDIKAILLKDGTDAKEAEETEKQIKTVLFALFGKQYLVKTVKTADGYVSLASAKGETGFLANKSAIEPGKRSQIFTLQLCKTIRTIGAAIAKSLPPEEANAVADFVNKVPNPGSDPSGISIDGEMKGGSFVSATSISLGEFQRIINAVSEIQQAGSAGSDDEEEE